MKVIEMEAAVGVWGIAGMVVCICMVSWIWKVISWVWLKPKKLEKCLREQGVNGTPYKLLFGDVKEVNMMNKKAQSKPMDSLSHDIISRVLPFELNAINNYGKNSFTWKGPWLNLNVMDPEMIKEALNKINNFQKPRIAMTDGLVSGLVKHEGQIWAKHRTLLNPAYRIEKLKLLLPAFETSCEEMLKEWETMARGKGCLEVDLWDCFHDLSCNMLARAAFGSYHEQGRKIFLLQREQVSLGLQALKTVLIPGARYLPTKLNRRMKETEKEMILKFKAIIDKREEGMQRGETSNTDLLGLYMGLSQKQIQEHGKEAGLTLTELIDECKAFYLAGENATSVLLTWTMVLLSMHQDWQTKAREEVLQVFGKNKPDFEGLNRLKIVSMILHETSRLYPPAVMLHRMVYKETKLGKLTLPPGVMITLPIMLVQHDRDLWGDDADEFRPERFAEGAVKATKGQVSLFPFSWGPRTCIGQNFGMLQAKLTVSLILQRFWCELSPSYSHAPYNYLTLQPQHGAHIILHKIE